MMKQIFAAVLAGLATMAMAAETNLEIKGPRDYTAWGSRKYYQTPPTVTLADGVVKVTCGKTIEGVKPTNFQFAVRSAREYKAGATYTVTFTLKSSKDVNIKGARANIQHAQAPFKIFGTTPITLTANEAKEFKIVAKMTEDVTVRTCTPCLHIPLQEGQTLELSNVKFSEE